MYMRIYILTNGTARSFAPAAIQVDASFFILAMVDGAASLCG
jgi:dolichol kinase